LWVNALKPNQTVEAWCGVVWCGMISEPSANETLTALGQLLFASTDGSLVFDLAATRITKDRNNNMRKVGLSLAPFAPKDTDKLSTHVK